MGKSSIHSYAIPHRNALVVNVAPNKAQDLISNEFTQHVYAVIIVFNRMIAVLDKPWWHHGPNCSFADGMGLFFI